MADDAMFGWDPLKTILQGWLQDELVDPRSPLGAGGPGHFRSCSPLGSERDLQLIALGMHPLAPASRFGDVLLDSRLNPPSSPNLGASHVETVVRKLSPADFDAAAKTLGLGVSAAIVRAFAEVESGGKSGFGPGGLPIIAYEGHIFRKYTGKKYDSTYPLLSYPYKEKAGPEWQQNNRDQDTAWATLAKAMALDPNAAQQACSWGMFQVMGFNYGTCGYPTVDAFVAAMKASETTQLQAFVGYCKATRHLVAAMASKDFQKMALLYNGPDNGDYDKRIERAYKKYGGA